MDEDVGSEHSLLTTNDFSPIDIGSFVHDCAPYPVDSSSSGLIHLSDGFMSDVSDVSDETKVYQAALVRENTDSLISNETSVSKYEHQAAPSLISENSDSLISNETSGSKCEHQAAPSLISENSVSENFHTSEERFPVISCLLNDQDKEIEVDDDQAPFDFSFLQDDVPLYQDAPITFHESLVSILTLVLTFKLSGVCLQSILQLIQLHLPKCNNKFKTSLHFFKEYFFNLQSPKEFEYYCSVCFSQFSSGSSCPKNCPQSSTCYLIKIPVLDQLKTLFRREGFFGKLNFVNTHIPGQFKDIYDGEVYQDHVKKGFLGNQSSLSLQWYTDGVALYNSTNFSVWLTYLTINELPYNQRFKKENVLVPVIWCGSTKPPGNLIMNSMHPELKVLSLGVNYDIHGTDSKKIKFFVVNGTADLPAKAMMLNMKESNGAESCQKCEQPGEPRVNFSGVRIFPYQPVMTLRTNENYLKYSKEAHSTGKPVVGVKGISTLSMIVMDVIRGTAIDPMHLIGGVAKKLTSLLLCTKLESKKWSIASHLDTLDKRLLSIKSPAHIMRGPRSLREIAYWKMSEHQHWLVEFAVPVLYQILPRRYFLHFCSLVAAIQLLSSDVVSEEDIQNAEKLLHVFVSQMADFYNVNVLTMNFHVLLHIPQVVRDLGPMWVYTCFPLEDLNGIVLNLVHGTRWADRQIATSVQTCLGLPNIVKQMKDSEPKNFCIHLMNRRKFSNNAVVDNSVIIGDKSIVSTIPHDVQTLLDENNIRLSKAYELKSVKQGKFIYVSQKANLSKCKDSTVAVYRDENTLNVGVIQTFYQGYTCYCSNACTCESHIYVLVNTAFKKESFPTLIPGIVVPNIHEYALTNEAKLFPCTSLLGSCVLININKKNFISMPLNSKERE
ncbi:D-alanine--D-alanine ligase [Frankliniella fusca]|uniref:D-alanine--D-alanine ligase n=1 Tax=Frankliniella fusca TaxID=407009 RepID=A0AAE1HPP6_9NEOP|nr:D-alanine--D-alanine ligase [Frankliniella fusca]